ncbi:universal stress protein [Fulvivirgaceae bacterium PWU4]|uniref:Universal stress protein n=1 Tax=Chryseosolibacter histidini TaxID=2782349 RepID=A0AAP2DMU6_9BACT|nr:universal stress protein [Chryseosolibacter histidini]MBT1699271.1 universal stress protein [Chryseosolibacter histidini]
MKKILVPYDFSKPAQWALQTAIGVAKKAKARIILLHIVEQPTSESFNVEGQINNDGGWEDKLFTLKLIEKNKGQLEDAARLVEDEGIFVTCELRLGNPFHGIRTVITDSQADLVVMGTSGRSKLEEMIVGSNTEKVVRYAKCPVLTVHEEPNGKDFVNIVYASCLSENETEFASVVKNAQEMYNATIHLVRINTPMNFRSDHEVKKVMRDFARKLKLENYTINVFSDRSEEEGILHFASSVNADLIAMATHGRTGFAHVLVGSIAEDVVNHAQRPVLTYVTPELYR